jgi:hypothetical protein
MAVSLFIAGIAQAGIVYEVVWEHDGVNVHGFHIFSWNETNPADRYIIVVDSATARTYKFLHPKARTGETWQFAVQAFNYRVDNLRPSPPTLLRVAQVFVQE